MRSTEQGSKAPSAVALLAVIIICSSVAISACASKVAPPVEGEALAARGIHERPTAAGDKTREERASAPHPRRDTVLASASRAGGAGGAAQNLGGATSGRTRGGELFAKYCAICHGEEGDGGGKFAYLMNPRPRNFRKGDFKLATTQNQIPTDEDLIRTISRGMPGSAMPPWNHLPLSDLQALTKHVRRLHLEATKEELGEWVAEGTIQAHEVAELLAQRTEPGPPLMIPPNPPFDEVRWFRGRRLYLENCANCHGVDGNPVPEAVKTDEEGYPVPPRSFVKGIFKGGNEGHQLYACIVKGMKGTPMPASEGVYSDDEIWDLIHYVQSLARAGAQQRAQLKQGTFAAPNIRRTLPSGPMDPAWDQARPLYVALTPLWWTEDRIEGLVVRALHNDEELAIRLSWIDPTPDDRAVRQDEFRDGVAIQFSLTSDPPFYMGTPQEHGGVNIWYWKADRQKDIAEGYRDVEAAFPAGVVDMYPEQRYRITHTSAPEWPRSAITEHAAEFITGWGAGNLVSNPNLKTPVECLVARGPGTLSGKPANVQLVQGAAVYERGVWYVELRRTMSLPHEHEHSEERLFEPGDYLPVSFAIWNGAAGDRDGKKNISIWQKMVIE